MKFTILWSGWATPTPRIWCQCENCSAARINPKLKRNHSSLFIEESKILIDCPEDIGDSLYKNNITSIEHLFLTHWHPDHTFWLRIILESTFDFYLHEVIKPITLHLPRGVHEDLKKYYPTIAYLIDTNKLAKVEYIEHWESVQIDDIRVTAVWFSGEESHTYSFLFETNKKKCMYAPCDTFGLMPEVIEIYFKNLDVLIHECGIHSQEVKTEVSFSDLIERLRFCKPQKTILTHIEEIEVKRWWLPYFQELINTYSDVSFEYAHDGLCIII